MRLVKTNISSINWLTCLGGSVDSIPSVGDGNLDSNPKIDKNILFEIIVMTKRVSQSESYIS